MSMIDRQICNALDRMHAEMAGLRAPCRWSYDSKRDAYFCEHINIPGKDVVQIVNPVFVEG